MEGSGWSRKWVDVGSRGASGGGGGAGNEELNCLQRQRRLSGPAPFPGLHPNSSPPPPTRLPLPLRLPHSVEPELEEPRIRLMAAAPPALMVEGK